jgi:hypothetical protein
MVGDEKGALMIDGMQMRRRFRRSRGWAFSIKPWTGRGQEWAAGEEGRDIWSGGETKSALGTAIEAVETTITEGRMDIE